jgi:hypothetical protein
MPCGRPKRSVISYEMECASAVFVLENASPAYKSGERHFRAQRAVARDAASIAEDVASTSRAAATAWLSEMGLAFTFQMDSSACDSASSPLCSVTGAGSVSISSGSITAASGQVCGRCSEYLLLAARSQIVAHGVTSLPVPAVVGTAISGLTSCGVNATAGCQQVDQFLKSLAFGADHQRLGGVDRAAAADGDEQHRSPHARARTLRTSLAATARRDSVRSDPRHPATRADQRTQPVDQAELAGLRKRHQHDRATVQASDGNELTLPRPAVIATGL